MKDEEARPTDAASKQKGVQSVEVAAKVLEVLRKAPGPLALSAIARQCGYSPSQTHAHLVSLTRAGFVEQRKASGLYDLGPFARSLGLTALARFDRFDIMRDVAETLNRDTGLTVAVNVWSDNGPLVALWLRSSPPLATNINVGSFTPITFSAAGLIFCGHLPRDLVRPQFEREKASSRRPIDLDAFERAAVEARTRGYSTMSDTLFPGIRVAAAPLLRQHGELVAVVSLVGSAMPFQRDIEKKDIELLLDTLSQATIVDG
ncbi:IclR family transcriptional regulator [Bradyrhizobium sp. KBS0727]|uniref:IclR family transcriptional regulator n=1 Tax=unclassified Bradyrhizobium TaxID=2631580 RepID=UPI00110EBCD4|nr:MULTISPECIES: IclR family transcriptional regulator [unclassified Bradyrhizobium]QDW39834.1 IclR family transcriptional regulator [Bradyrhizobium sp. KBS0725]QDW46437.1 IclR family transcriptional regulator [Bradyrhizobium sp. KBS0727]